MNGSFSFANKTLWLLDPFLNDTKQNHTSHKIFGKKRIIKMRLFYTQYWINTLLNLALFRYEMGDL